MIIAKLLNQEHIRIPDDSDKQVLHVLCVYNLKSLENLSVVCFCTLVIL